MKFRENISILSSIENIKMPDNVNPVGRLKGRSKTTIGTMKKRNASLSGNKISHDECCMPICNLSLAHMKLNAFNIRYKIFLLIRLSRWLNQRHSIFTSASQKTPKNKAAVASTQIKISASRISSRARKKHHLVSFLIFFGVKITRTRIKILLKINSKVFQLLLGM